MNELLWITVVLTVIRKADYMSINTFSEGIIPGGLREKSEIRLLVCYLLKRFDKAITRSKINEILAEDSIANYFEINQAISELIKDGCVLCEIEGGEELLMLSGKMMYEVEKIEKSLPRSIREKSVSAALRIFSRDRIQQESLVEVQELEKGYHVTFIVKDVGTELLKLTVYVSDYSQVELVKRNFYNNAESIYSDIISSLTVE